LNVVWCCMAMRLHFSDGKDMVCRWRTTFYVTPSVNEHIRTEHEVER